ncbi:sensor histidine kinase [Isoptericola sp. NEAU-Y5]|uniref:Oxygen sensor histidine kinase NreB n=1 Tax=Isoptericola luteus TaxID=2879484 RepID=A0ABS7ZGH2_9MICO|nr:sensor histidine kinase [Isoptericola sp. NEAU-Y5]MCA5892689.1 sensor histidine kinase [Isoptericola sp. NEAU-Y5]
MTTAEGLPDGGTPLNRYDAEDGASWDRQVVWWDAAFVGIVVLTAVALPLSGVTGAALGIALGAMAALLVAYLLWGARAARTREQGPAVAYVVVLIVATTVSTAQASLATLLLFAAFSQIFMLLEPARRAALASAVLATATAFGIAFQGGFDLPTLLEAAPQMVVALAFALLLGLWFATVMRRSDERARLLGELEEAQAQLAESHHSAGVTAERERIAREIHDTLAQGFTSVVTQAQAAVAALDRDEPARARERLLLVEQTARDNLAEARALVAAFAPVALQDSTLAEALRRLAERFTAETGTPVRLEVADGQGGPAPDPTSDVVLLRAAQEALANVRRHAAAHTVVVRLDLGAGVVRLAVDDDGTGIAPDRPEGIGLAGMRDRVRAVGGWIDVGPGRDGGTRLEVRLPAHELPEHEAS